MKIKLLSVRNLKGRDFDYPLSPVNIVVGSNFSGKTAVSDALKIGLLGYLPKLGKQNSATYQLAGPAKAMSVTLQLDPEEILRHTWTKQNSGTIKYEPELPPLFSTPAVLLDTSEYFSKTSAERMSYVFNQVPIKAWNDQDVIQRIAAIEALPIKVAEPTIKEASKLTAQSISERDINKWPIQRWLDELLSDFKERAKTAALLAKNQTATIQTNRSALNKISTKSADQSAKIAQISEALEKTRNSITQLREQQRQAEQVANRKSTIETALAGYTSKTEEINKVANQISKLATSLTGRDTLARQKFLQTKISTLKLNIGKTDSEIGFSNKAIVKAEEQIVSLEKHGCCPVCKSNSDNWLETATDTYRLSIRKNSENIALNKTHQVKLQVELAETEKELAKLFQDQQKKEVAKLKLSEAQRQLVNLQNEEFRIAQYREELKNLETIVMPDPKELANLAETENTFEVEWTACKQIQAEYDYQKHLLSQIVKAEEEYVKQETAVAVWKKATEVIQTIQEDQVHEVFNFLLDKSRLFTYGILLSPLEYHDGQLGRMDKNHWISHETFSGTEELLAYAGLSVALAQKSPVKLVIMDELGRLIRPIKEKLIERMVELTKAGHIDQFLGIDVYGDDYKLNPDVNIITIS